MTQPDPKAPDVEADEPTERPGSRPVLLVVYKGAERDRGLVFSRGPILIGRAPYCDVCLDERYIDEVQLALWTHEDRHYIAEVSYARALMNGERFFTGYRSQEFLIGDFIELGNYELELEAYDPGPTYDGPTLPRFQLPDGVLEE